MVVGVHHQRVDGAARIHTRLVTANDNWDHPDSVDAHNDTPHPSSRVPDPDARIQEMDPGSVDYTSTADNNASASASVDAYAMRSSAPAEWASRFICMVTTTLGASATTLTHPLATHI
jgi:hypothetical protein